MTQQTVSKHLRKIGSYRLGRLQSQQDHPITRTVLQQQCSMKQKHTKYTQINANESTHSEMAQCDKTQSREQELLI